MKILFVAPLSPDSATVRYRCLHLAEALRRSGHEVDVVRADAAHVVVRHDLVVLHRLFWHGAGGRFHAAARAVGASVVYGVDDLIFTPEFAFHVGLLHPDDPARLRYHRNEVNENRAMLEKADAVLVTTDFLASRAREAVSDRVPVYVQRNFPGEEIRAASRLAREEAANLRRLREDDRVTLGYLSGSPTHDSDLADIAAPLAAVLGRMPNARLLLVGAVGVPEALRPLQTEGRVRRHPAVPWRDLPALLAGIDINLAPLDPVRAFTHAKSEVKFLEAALVGVPTIAGWAAGFAEAVRDGENCLLARTGGDWDTLIARLAIDPDERRRIGGAALASVSDPAAIEAQTTAVAAIFADIHAQRLGYRDASAPEAVVRRPARETFIASLKKREAQVVGGALRLSRHLGILREELQR